MCVCVHAHTGVGVYETPQIRGLKHTAHLLILRGTPTDLILIIECGQTQCQRIFSFNPITPDVHYNVYHLIPQDASVLIHTFQRVDES